MKIPILAITCLVALCLASVSEAAQFVFGSTTVRFFQLQQSDVVFGDSGDRSADKERVLCIELIDDPGNPEAEEYDSFRALAMAQQPFADRAAVVVALDPAVDTGDLIEVLEFIGEREIEDMSVVAREVAACARFESIEPRGEAAVQPTSDGDA